VAREPLSLRVARATNHLRSELMAGFTTIRDLGTEGAGFADVVEAGEQESFPGRAGRRHARDRCDRQLRTEGLCARMERAARRGRATARQLTRVVREQSAKARIGIKVYADYRWARAAPRTLRSRLKN